MVKFCFATVVWPHGEVFMALFTSVQTCKIESAKSPSRKNQDPVAWTAPTPQQFRMSHAFVSGRVVARRP
jgi:hypothetical protein